MKKTIIGAALIAVLSQGCIAGMLTNTLVPRPSPHPRKEALEYHKELNKQALDKISLLIEKDEIPAKQILKTIDREMSRSHKAGSVDRLAMVGNQIIGNTTRPMVEEGLKSGFEWTRNTITEVAGGAGLGSTGIGLIAWRLLSGRRRERVLKTQNKIYKNSLDGAGRKRAEESARHTEVEGLV